MTLYEPEIDRAMWNSDVHEIRSGIYKAVIRLSGRGFFTGRIYRAGSLIASNTSDDLRTLVRNLNESIRGTLNDRANTFRSEAVPGRDSRVARTPEKARIGTRPSDQVHAGAQSKIMGNSQAKTAFDWGQNLEREVGTCRQPGARSGDAGQEDPFSEPRDAEREGVGADVLS